MLWLFLIGGILLLVWLGLGILGQRLFVECDQKKGKHVAPPIWAAMLGPLCLAGAVIYLTLD